MKKTVFVLGLAALVAVSCKKKEETPKVGEPAVENVETTVEKAEETAENVADAFADVPKFSNEETQKFAEEFATYYKELAGATKSADATKIAELQKKGVELAKTAQEKMMKMSAEDAKLWAEWSQKIAEAAQGK